MILSSLTTAVGNQQQANIHLYSSSSRFSPLSTQLISINHRLQTAQLLYNSPTVHRIAWKRLDTVDGIHSTLTPEPTFATCRTTASTSLVSILRSRKYFNSHSQSECDHGIPRRSSHSLARRMTNPFSKEEHSSIRRGNQGWEDR
jgi:hypothetical protein